MFKFKCLMLKFDLYLNLLTSNKVQFPIFYLEKLQKGESQTTKRPVPKTTTATSTQTTTKKPLCTAGKRWCDVRLPQEIRPSHYDLKLTSDVEKLVYQGTQVINIAVSSPIDVVLVHIKEKSITKVLLESSPGKDKILSIKVSYMLYTNAKLFVQAKVLEN